MIYLELFWSFFQIGDVYKRQLYGYLALKYTGEQTNCIAQAFRLMLLGSPPDMVHGVPSHSAHPSVYLKARILPCLPFSVLYKLL